MKNTREIHVLERLCRNDEITKCTQNQKCSEGKIRPKKTELESKPTKSAQAEEKISKTWMGRTECVALFFMEKWSFFTTLTLFRLREKP